MPVSRLKKYESDTSHEGTGILQHRIVYTMNIPAIQAFNSNQLRIIILLRSYFGWPKRLLRVLGWAVK